MSEDFEIKTFLLANTANIKQMCLTEYNETETMEMFRITLSTGLTIETITLIEKNMRGLKILPRHFLP